MSISILGLPSTAFFFCLGTVLMGILMFVQRKLYGLQVWKTLLLTLILAAVGLAGVRLLAIAEHWDELLNGYISGGMSFFGSVLLVPLLMPLAGLFFKLRPRQTMDLCAPCVAGIVGVMRINCWISGCCGGFRFIIHGKSFVPPTQIIDGGWDFLLMGFLLWFNLKRKREGIAYPLFLVGYGFMRFFVEFLRDTEKDWLGFSHGQVFSVIALVIGTILILRSLKCTARRRK